MIIRDFKLGDENKGLLDVYSEVWYIDKITKKTIQNYLSNDNHMIVVENDGVIIGTLTLHIQKKIIRNGGIAGMIEDVAISEKFRGNGIGSDMIKYAIKKATELGCYKVILSCYPERESFYVKNGFKNENITMRYSINKD